MIDFYQAGQRAAFQKLGYDADDAHKVLQVAKKYTLPKASARLHSVMNPAAGFMGITDFGPAGAGGLKTQVKNQRKLYQGALDKMPSQRADIEATLPLIHKDNPEFNAMRSITNNWKSPQVIMPGNINNRKALSPHAPLGAAFTSEQNKMLNSIVGGHELDEGRVFPGLAMRQFGHISPEVMLREHNRVATMPEGYAPVRELMQHAREGREAELLKEYGINYGSSERVNRHQRKHLTRLMEEKAMMESERASKAQKEMLASFNFDEAP